MGKGALFPAPSATASARLRRWRPLVGMNVYSVLRLLGYNAGQHRREHRCCTVYS